MPITLKPLAQQVVVITGATSGIGLATAQAAAAKGAKLVLTARDQAGLDEVAAELRRSHPGAEVATLAADVSSRPAVQKVADLAVTRFGGFDTWVNDAGVAIIGKLEEIDEADHHRIVDTNFWGTVHGSLVAVAHLKVRGGALVNVGSIASDEAIPLQSMYSASKHAVKGFTNGLRRELESEGAPVSLTLIKPAAVATPLADHVKNYESFEPRLPPPLYAPEEVAYAILHAAEHPRRETYVGGAGRLMILMGAHAPGLADRLAATVGILAQKTAKPAQVRPDNLDGPVDSGELHSRKQGAGRRSLYTRAVLNPGATGAVLAAAAGLTALSLRARSSRRS